MAVTLAVGALSLTSCSSGGSTPSSGDHSSDTPGGSTSTNSTTTLKKVKVKKGKSKGASAGVANQIVTLASGAKISLSAPAPGHSVLAQVEQPKATGWSKPATVFKDTNRFCHAIKMVQAGGVAAATVSCSLTSQDAAGTQESYVLATTDGITWKRADLSGADDKPSISATGKFVAFESPSSFVIWSPTGTFHPVHYTQDDSAPTIGLMQDTGVLLLVKALADKKDCVVSFQTVTSTATTPHTINSTLPQSDHPKCAISNAAFRGTDIVANLTMTEKVETAGKKSYQTTTFAWEFDRESDGHWVIKT
jgi:hypothetical protein